MADNDDWLKQYRAAMERQRRHSERLAEYLLPALRFLGVSAVVVEYDGHGDEGDVQDAFFENQPAAGLPEGMVEFAAEACRWALPGGWDDNAGSWGEWVIDVEDGSSDLDHYWRDAEPQDEE